MASDARMQCNTWYVVRDDIDIDGTIGAAERSSGCYHEVIRLACADARPDAVGIIMTARLDATATCNTAKTDFRLASHGGRARACVIRYWRGQCNNMVQQQRADEETDMRHETGRTLIGFIACVARTSRSSHWHR